MADVWYNAKRHSSKSIERNLMHEIAPDNEANDKMVTAKMLNTMWENLFNLLVFGSAGQMESQISICWIDFNGFIFNWNWNWNQISTQNWIEIRTDCLRSNRLKDWMYRNAVVVFYIWFWSTFDRHKNKNDWQINDKVKCILRRGNFHRQTRNNRMTQK